MRTEASWSVELKRVGGITVVEEEADGVVTKSVKTRLVIDFRF